nr:MAG TPA: hypothetical protein [Bacteriophage sp.]
MAKKPTKSTAVANYDEQLAALMQQEVETEKSVNTGGKFISTKGGQLTYDGNPMKDNEMYVVILDHIFENAYYEGRFNPDNPQPPTCFAFGRNEKDMIPHVNVTEAEQNPCDNCHDCPMNQWGSDGKGKACKNVRRLALIPAGHVDRKTDELELYDEDHFLTAEVAYLKLPVTSTKGFSTYVKQVAQAYNKPVLGVITRVYTTPDPKTQYKVNFEAIEEVPAELLGALMQRRAAVTEEIDFPYSLERDEQPAQAPKGRGRQAPGTAKRGKY